MCVLILPSKSKNAHNRTECEQETQLLKKVGQAFSQKYNICNPKIRLDWNIYILIQKLKVGMHYTEGAKNEF